MELNAEQIAKALKYCTDGGRCLDCQYDKGNSFTKEGCMASHMRDALALITSQEQRIKELEQCWEHEHASAMEIFGQYGEKCDRLTKENERLKGRNEHLTECLVIEDKYKERLRGILLQFTDIVYKWGNKNGYDTSEISLVPIIYEANTIKSQIEADTARKMQTEIKERCIKGGIYPAFVASTIDQIAKEIMEGE